MGFQSRRCELCRHLRYHLLSLCEVPSRTLDCSTNLGFVYFIADVCAQQLDNAINALIVFGILQYAQDILDDLFAIWEEL